MNSTALNTDNESSIWASGSEWPKGDREHVFLAEVLQEVGAALHGQDWTTSEPLAATEYHSLRPALVSACNAIPERESFFPVITPITDRPQKAALTRAKNDFLQAESRIAQSHVYAWRDYVRRTAAKRRLDQAQASFGRLVVAMNWIREQASLEESLETNGRSVTGGDYFELPRSIWNVEKIWARRFKGCEIDHDGVPTYLFIRRPTLVRCLRLKLKAARGPHPSSLEESDAPLVEVMRALILEREVSGPYQAALRIADQAAGGSTLDSKIRRLEKRYISKYGK